MESPVDHPDHEDFTGKFISSLHDLHVSPEDILADFNHVCSMSHNSGLKGRVLGKLRSELRSLETETREGALSAQALLNHLGGEPPCISAHGRIVLFDTLCRVGVGCRKSDAFPPALSLQRCEEIDAVVVAHDGGEPLLTSANGIIWRVLRPLGGGCSYALDPVFLRVSHSPVRKAFAVVEVVVFDTPSGMPVYRFDRPGRPQNVAIKILAKGLDLGGEDPVKEIKFHAWVKSQGPAAAAVGDQSRCNLANALLEDDESVFLVLPFLQDELYTTCTLRPSGDGGRPEALTEDEVRIIFRQILDGVVFLHGLGLAHRDLSLENILLDDDGGAVVCDFGMVARVPLAALEEGATALIPVKMVSSQRWPCRCGKSMYCPPLEDPPRPAFDPFLDDMWSMGVMLFVLFTSVPPWEYGDVRQGGALGPKDASWVLHHLRQGSIGAVLEHWGSHYSHFRPISVQGVDLLQRMLSPDSTKRPTALEAREHSWFQ